jgi:alpha-beta hydrolase superfamily lysophospholipase
MGTGRDPLDMSSNLRAIAGDTSAVGLAVAAALRDAGVRRGEPLLLTGHSQGGLVAASLAANPSFNSTYTVKGVLTAGSPVANIPVLPHIQVLSLEHVQDVIPTLEGAANPAGKNHTTVIRDLRKSDIPEIRRNATDQDVAHSAPTYAQTAALADRFGDHSIEVWKAAVAPTMDSRSKAVQTIYSMRRVVQR